MPARKAPLAEPSLEESMQRLEKIVETLEQGEIPLEESLKLYEEGVALSKVCAEKLQRAEVTLKRLTRDARGNFTLAESDQE